MAGFRDEQEGSLSTTEFGRSALLRRSSAKRECLGNQQHRDLAYLEVKGSTAGWIGWAEEGIKVDCLVSFHSLLQHVDHEASPHLLPSGLPHQDRQLASGYLCGGMTAEAPGTIHHRGWSG